MKGKVRRDVLSQVAKSLSEKSVLPQSIMKKSKDKSQSGRISLRTLQKGSMTIEAAWIMPFFLLMLLAFFSMFHKYEVAAELNQTLQKEAKQLGVLEGISGKGVSGGKIYLERSRMVDNSFNFPFSMTTRVRGRAVCRAWIGFTTLEEDEIYVYITAGGTVYHLSASCTHLDLSISRTELRRALQLKNLYGESYRACELCVRGTPAGQVYITNEGNCYHSSRDCTGLKRDVLCVPLSKAAGRPCCQRCGEGGT